MYNGFVTNVKGMEGCVAVHEAAAEIQQWHEHAENQDQPDVLENFTRSVQVV